MSSFLRCGWQWTSSWYELLASTAVPVSPRAQAQKTQVYIKVTHEGVPPGAPLSPRPAPHGKHHDGSEGGEGGGVSAKNPLSLLGASGHKSPPVLPALGEGGGGGLLLIEVTGSGPGGRHWAATAVLLTLFSPLDKHTRFTSDDRYYLLFSYSAPLCGFARPPCRGNTRKEGMSGEGRKRHSQRCTGSAVQKDVRCKMPLCLDHISGEPVAAFPWPLELSKSWI